MAKLSDAEVWGAPGKLSDADIWGDAGGDEGPGRLAHAAGSVGRGTLDIATGTLTEVSRVGQHRDVNLSRGFDLIDSGVPANDAYQQAKGIGVGLSDYLQYEGADPESRAKLREIHVGDPSAPLTERPAYKAGTALTEFGQESLPNNPNYAGDFFTDAVPRGLGTVAGFLASGAARGGPAIAGALTGAGLQTRDAVESDATPEQIDTAAAYGAGLGLTDAVPIGIGAGALASGVGSAVKRIAGTTAAEAVQEAGQTLGENLVASDLAAYDPDRPLIEGVGEATAVGGVVGFTMQTLGETLAGVFGGRRGGKGASGSPQSEDDPGPAPGDEQEGGPQGKTQVNANGFQASVDLKDGVAQGTVKARTGAGEGVPLYAGPEESEQAFIVDTVDPETGAFVDSRLVMGVPSQEAARALYTGQEAADSIGAITPVSASSAREWLAQEGNKRTPFADSALAGGQGRRDSNLGQPERTTYAPVQVNDGGSPRFGIEKVTGQTRERIPGAEFSSIETATRLAGRMTASGNSLLTPNEDEALAESASSQGIAGADTELFRIQEDPRYSQEQKDEAANVVASLVQVLPVTGHGAGLRFEDQILMADSQAAKASGAAGSPYAAGATVGGRLIKVALNFQEQNFDPTDTAYHEAVHVLQGLAKEADPALAKTMSKAFPERGRIGALPPSIRRLLKRTPSAITDGNTVFDDLKASFGNKPLSGSELQAVALAAYARARADGVELTMPGTMRKVLDLFLDFFEALGSKVAGGRFQTQAGLAKDFESGALGRGLAGQAGRQKLSDADIGLEPAPPVSPAPAPEPVASAPEPTHPDEAPSPEPGLPETAAPGGESGQVDIGSVVPRQEPSPPVRSTPARPRGGAHDGESILPFLAQWGVQDQRGELSHMGAQHWHREGSFRRKLVREDGLTIHEARERAEEEGFLPVGSYDGDLLNMIEEELKVTPQLRSQDAQAEADRLRELTREDEDRKWMERQAAEVGIETTGDEDLTDLHSRITAAREAADTDLARLDAILAAEDDVDRIVREELARSEEDNAPIELEGPPAFEDAGGDPEPAPAQAGPGEQPVGRPEAAPGEQEAAGLGAGVRGERDQDGAQAALVDPPAVDLTDQGPQPAIPGAEKIPDRELAERRMEGRQTAAAPQKDADEGLFDLGARAQTDLLDAVNEAAAEADPAPTEAQKEAGNYKKGHVTVHGLDITIENEKGSIRSGTDPDGNPWEVRMPAHYGYIKRTEGADGEQVDVYLGDNPASEQVFVVFQKDLAANKFDEHKIVIGVATAEEARALYEAGFSDGRGAERLDRMETLSIDQFKAKLEDGAYAKGRLSPKANRASADEQFAAAQPNSIAAADITRATPPDTFVLSPAGQIDYGRITEEVAAATGLKPLPIRLRVGDRTFGLRHIDQRHGKAVKAVGGSIERFVWSVAQGYNQIRRSGAGDINLVRQRPGENRLVGMALAEDSGFYTVNTAFLPSVARGTLLWEERRRQTSPDSGDQAPYTAPSDKSGEGHRSARDTGNTLKLGGRGKKINNDGGEQYSATRYRDATPTQKRLVDSMSDEAVAKIVKLARNETDVQYAAAWHGSPHDFDQFTTNAMGTGEGVHAFGWGLYFAGKKQIANHYREALSRNRTPPREVLRRYFSPGNIVPSYSGFDRVIAFNEGTEDGDWFVDVQAVERDEDGNWVKARGLSGLRPRRHATTPSPKDIEKVTGEKSGRLYKVELAPAEDEYLYWDKPVSQQSAKVRNALTAVKLPFRFSGLLEPERTFRPWLKEELASAHSLDKPAWKLYSSIGRRLGSEEAASKALLAAGIPGIKYLDQGSRGAGEGTYNYVIFDDNQITVEEKYSATVSPQRRRRRQTAGRVATETARITGSLAPGQPAWSAPEDRVRDHLNIRNLRAVRSGQDLVDLIARATQAGGAEALRIKTQDAFLRVRRVEERIAQARGRPIDDQLDPYTMETLHHGKIGHLLDEFERGPQANLIRKINDAGFTIEDVEAYLYARHAPERNAHIATINDQMPDGGSGIDTATAAAYLRGAGPLVAMDGTRVADPLDLAQVPALEAIAGDVYAILESARDVLEQGGILSGFERQAWEKSPRYVPLRNQDVGNEDVISTGQGFDQRQRASFQAMGRQTPAGDILAHVMTLYETALIRAEKNQVGLALARLVAANPNPEVWSVNKIEHRREIGADGMVHLVATPQSQLGDKVFAVRHGGDVYYITLEDERLAQAMKKLGPQNMNIVVQMLGKLNRFLAGVNTSFSPDFIVANFLRDLQTALVNLQAEDMPAIAREVVKNTPSAIRGINNYLRGDRSHAWAQHFDEFRRNGAQTGYTHLKSVAERRGELQAKLRDINATSPRKALNAAKAVIDLVQDANTAVENGVRLSAFVAARQRGLPAQQAAAMAKNLTVNFNRRGEWAATMNALYLFYNASFQGIMRTLQALRSKTVRRIMFGAVVLGAMQELVGSLMYDDGDDNDWDKLSRWDKEHNFIIPNPWHETGDDPAALKIPMPYGYNVFPATGAKIMEAIRGKKEPTKAAAEIVGLVLDAYNLLGDSTLVTFFTPTALDPVMELGANVNFTGRPIYPERLWDERPRSEQAWRSTSETAKAVSSALNRLSGGSEFRSGAVDWYPDALEHVFDFLTGSAGATVRRVGDVAQTVAKGEELPLRTVPIVRRLVVGQNEWYETFAWRDIANEIKRQSTNYKAAKSAGSANEVAVFREEYGPELSMVGEQKRIAKLLRKDNNRITAINGNDRLSEEEKSKRVKAIQDRMNEYRRKARLKYERLVREAK